jgi:hypothetical protein
VNGRRVLQELAVFAFCVVVAVVLTWPLATNLPTAVADLGDPLLNAWILDWDCHALLRAPWRIFQAPVFYPSKYALAYSENMIAVAALVLPFHVAGVPPIGVYNIALLAGLTLSAYAGYVLARLVTGNAAASFIVGLLYGFVPYKLAHLQHLQILWSIWPPLLLAALLVYRRAPSWRNAALIGACIVPGAMTNLYFFIFSMLALAATLVLTAIAERRDSRFWMRIAAALAVAGAILIPVLWPYAAVAKEYEMRRGMGEALGNSATPSDWLIAPQRSVFYGGMTDPDRRHSERELFPGLVMLLLAGAALLLTPRRHDPPPTAATRKPPLVLDALIVVFALLTYIGAVTEDLRFTIAGQVVAFGTTKFPAMLLLAAIVARLAIRFPRALGDGNLRSALQRSRFPLELWIAAVWIAIGILGSFGLNTFFHSFLLQYVPGLRATRVPARWAMIAYAGLIPWTAWGAVALARGRRAVGVALVALALVDIWPRIRWEMAPVENSPVDRWIAEAKAGPLFFLPIDRLNLLYEYMLRSTLHHQPIMNAISGFEPPLHRALRSEPLSDRTLDRLEQNGYRFVVVRPDWAGGGVHKIFPWLQRNLLNGRLAFVQRFDYAMNGDWVFAITRVERQWSRFRAPGAKDDDLRRLFSGRHIPSASTFGQLYQPSNGAEIHGPLTVSGWAISPHGIRSVTVLIDAGRHRFPAALFARDDVTARFPGYPQTPRPAFATLIPNRPRGVRPETDVQIEIIDGRGEITRLRDALIVWR